MLQSKALIPDNTPYPLLFILLNILYYIIRPKINTSLWLYVSYLLQYWKSYYDIYEVNILSCTMLTTYLYEVNIVSAGS